PLDSTLKLQLSQWIRQGKVIRLKKGFYTLNEMDRQARLSPYILINELYNPSYVSLEFALNHYGLIPEAAGSFTCITTNKTKTFKNQLGVFIYHRIKKHYFFGFTKNQSADGHDYFLAQPEKAVLDFIYYTVPAKESDLRSVLLDNYRFQNLDILNNARLNEYASRFDVGKIKRAVPVLKELVKEWEQNDR
ncbi:MAG: hypothetical protein JW827_02885, partial [Spirochaetes bacterium]|nr:hypothetical protein [Spirochaetota bacterium]